MRKGLHLALLIAGLFIISAVASFVIWGETPAKPMPEALAALQSNSQMTVVSDKWLVFTPVAFQPVTGFIIYPGGRVDYRSYAPTARQIAAQGYLVVIVHMPLNLAVFDPSAAQEVIAAHPEIEHWVVGGHSLGGAMAANFASNYPGAVEGLVLWAAYPASSDDLSTSGLSVVSIYGTLDGLATGAKIDASRVLLPSSTIWVAIEGGNHAQFGWYGSQPGDNAAAISHQEQQDRIIASTVTFLEAIR